MTQKLANLRRFAGLEAGSARPQFTQITCTPSEVVKGLPSKGSKEAASSKQGPAGSSSGERKESGGGASGVGGASSGGTGGGGGGSSGAFAAVGGSSGGGGGKGVGAGAGYANPSTPEEVGAFLAAASELLGVIEEVAEASSQAGNIQNQLLVSLVGANWRGLVGSCDLMWS